MLAATDDPCLFDMHGFDFEDIFDGTRDIEVPGDVNTFPPFDPNTFAMFENLLGSWDPQSEFELAPNGVTDTNHSLDASYGFLQSPLLELAPFAPDSNVDDIYRGQYEAGVVSPEETIQASTHRIEEEGDSISRPYVPPTGAGSSARRVAADWKDTIHLTPEQELPFEHIWRPSM
jgi:hypothetical protein